MKDQVRGGSAVIVLVIALGACASAQNAESQSPPPVSPSPNVDITIANYPGLPLDEILRGFEAANPGISVEITGVPDGAGATRPSLSDDLEGSGLADVVLVGDDGLASVFASADRFSDLADVGPEADPLPWAAERGADDQGQVLAVPVTIESAALCFRGDLLATAGIASSREELAALLGGDSGDWETYFDVGRRYHAATDQAWFDQPEMIWRAMVSQLPASSSADDALKAPDSELRARWNLLVEAMVSGLSAHQEAWNWDGGSGFVDGSFATFPCPHWAIDLVEANTIAAGGDEGTGWDVADVFPGGGWSWAGVYAAQSSESTHPDEASALVAWLTAPEQQARFYSAGVGVPSDTRAVDALAQDGGVRAFFDGAPVPAIVSARALRVPEGAMGAEELQRVLDAFLPLLHDVDSGAVDAPTAWARATMLLTEGQS